MLSIVLKIGGIEGVGAAKLIIFIVSDGSVKECEHEAEVAVEYL